MKLPLIFIQVLLFCSSLCSQTTISGVVLDNKEMPIIGANIFLANTYDGSITEADGSFSFTTSVEGEQKMVITYLGYETKEVKGDVSTMSNLRIKLRESAMALDAVEITASTFKAGDNSKVAVLKPLDVVTTAGSMGDNIAALQTLPGTTSNAEDGRLFVRGGDARETRIYIDGLKVFTPYSRSIGGTPQRGRYSPFLFKGLSFSTGGYSAAYGQALSGILDMNTTDNPAQTETNLSLMSVGLGIGHTQKWDKNSLSLSASYIDLTPYYWIVPTRLEVSSPFRGFSGETVYRHKINDGLIKWYVAGEYARIRVAQYDLDLDRDQDVSIDNYNIYSNTSMTKLLTDKTSIQTGFSAGINKDQLRLEDIEVDSELSGLNARLAFKTIVNDHFIINYGTDFMFQEDVFESKILSSNNIFDGTVNRTITGNFVESDYFFNKNTAIKLGLRGEYASLLKKYELSPRITLAQKLNDNSQVSAAWGMFTQEVDSEFLFYDEGVRNERAQHFLMNYNFKTDQQIFRVEAYYKKYDRLLTYTDGQFVLENINNDGNGKAYGLDVFWRADQKIKNLDFWISYGWLVNERKYLNYPEFATPPFSTTHNLSVVTKRFFSKIKSQVSLTYQFSSGRPYENPNTNGFLNERSNEFNNLSFSWAYLISQQKILFVSASNFPGFRNSYGSRYGSTPDVNGIFPSELIRPNEDRFFFIGFFMTLSEDKMKNQLDNL